MFYECSGESTLHDHVTGNKLRFCGFILNLDRSVYDKIKENM